MYWYSSNLVVGYDDYGVVVVVDNIDDDDDDDDDDVSLKLIRASYYSKLQKRILHLQTAVINSVVEYGSHM